MTTDIMQRDSLVVSYVSEHHEKITTVTMILNHEMNMTILIRTGKRDIWDQQPTKSTEAQCHVQQSHGLVHGPAA